MLEDAMMAKELPC
jgi:hypothetical protein